MPNSPKGEVGLIHTYHDSVLRLLPRRSRVDGSVGDSGRAAVAELAGDSFELADVLETVAAALDSGVVLLEGYDVVLANDAALALRVVRGTALASPLLARLVRDARRGGKRVQQDVELPWGAGRRPVNVTVAPVPGTERTVLLLRDLTEARRVEAVRRDFVASVSHELKTPVGGLLLLAEAIRDAAEDPVATLRFADRMTHEAGRLSQLVRDLLDLSRLQGGEPLPSPIGVDVTWLVQDAVDRVRVAAEAAGVDIAVGDCEGLHVWGDPRSLETALVNLLDNAINYSVAGKRVAVGGSGGGGDLRGRPGHRHRRRRPRPGLRALLPRRPGAVPAYRRHRPGARHRQARRGERRGSGVGLEPARHGVDLHPRPADSAEQPTGRRGPEPMTRVLVIEDEETFSETLQYMLDREGFQVAVAGTGPAGLEEYERNGADLVLLDVMLPGLPGTEVCRRLRSFSDVPVIMLTAKDSEVDKVVGLELGADDYVTKPFSARELVARIRAVLRRRVDSAELMPGIVEAGPVRIDVDRHVVTVSGEAVSLPLKEFELLELLVRNAGRVLTRGQIIDRVWGSDYVGDTKTLDVHVKRLRSKVEPDPGLPRHLVTIRGLGYKFEP